MGDGDLGMEAGGGFAVSGFIAFDETLKLDFCGTVFQVDELTKQENGQQEACV